MECPEQGFSIITCLYKSRGWFQSRMKRSSSLITENNLKHTIKIESNIVINKTSATLSVSPPREEQNPYYNTKPYMIINQCDINDTECKKLLKFLSQKIPNSLRMALAKIQCPIVVMRMAFFFLHFLGSLFKPSTRSWCRISKVQWSIRWPDKLHCPLIMCRVAWSSPPFHGH